MKCKFGFLYGILIMMILFGTGCTQTSNHDNQVHTQRTEHKQNNTKDKVKAKPVTKPETILNSLKDSKKNNLIYYALGDSLSVGLFSNSADSRFTSIFADDLQKGTGKKITEINNSSVGKTVTNFGLPNVQALINQKPDIVTIEFGTNDAAYGIDANNLGDFTNNLSTVVKLVKTQTNAKILLMTTWSPSDGKYIDNDSVYDQKIKQIGKEYHVQVVDMSVIWKNDSSVTKNDLGYSQIYNRQKDEFHPNQLGHDKIAQLLYKTVQTK